MSDNLMVTISGVRAVVGDTLSPELIVQYVSAFAETVKGKKIVLGTDSRVSREFVKSITIGTLLSKGYHVIDLGIVPTPTVQLMVEHLKADAGLVITASHNPVEWNGLKFIDSTTLFFAPEKCQELFDLANKNIFPKSSWQQLGKLEYYKTANDDHIHSLHLLPFINTEKIKNKKYKIALDTINGAGCEIMKNLLNSFGCELVQINSEATGIFAHTPEPIPANLSDLCKTVIDHRCDFGIAVDPDVDRCVLIDHSGTPIGEEYTLAIAVKFILQKKLGPVVKNMSTTMAIDDITRYYNCPIIETAVGEINVAKKMSEVKAVIGGEGNGGVMLPDLHIGRDAMVATAIVLQALTESNLTLQAFKLSLPQYEIIKDKVSIAGKNPDELIKKFKAHFKNEKQNDFDGLKITGKNWWLHLRKSNTEPIFRIIAEAPNKADALKIVKDAMNLI